jgi:hypothetical protein
VWVSALRSLSTPAEWDRWLSIIKSNIPGDMFEALAKEAGITGPGTYSA